MKVSSLLNRENNNLDLIRIILACLVILGHSPEINGNSEYWIDPIGKFFSSSYSGSLAVKLFFFISGLVVTNSLIKQRNPLQFLISRSFRLIPALLFVLVITVIVVGPLVTTQSVYQYFSDSETFRYIHRNLVFATCYSLPGVFLDNPQANSANGSLWSLRYEVGCYIALMAVFLFLKNIKKSYWNILFLIIVVDTLMPTRFIFGWLGDSPEIYLLPASFAFGAFCALNAEDIEINLGMIIGAYLLYFLFKGTVFTQLIFIFGFSIGILQMASSKVMLKRKPKYDISYGIYLWGFLVQQTLYHFTGHIYVGLHCVLALLISILLAFITCILIEQPCIALGKRTYTRLKMRFPAMN